MTQPKHKATLQVKTATKGSVTIPVKTATWGEDWYTLIHEGTFSFDATSEIGYIDIDKGNELVLTVTDQNDLTRIFYFFVDRVTSKFEKDPNTGKILVDEIIINAISYPSILTRNTIEGSFTFSNGYGEVVRKIAENYGFDITSVKLIKKEGTIYFKKLPILEAFRRMAALENWCFYFRDKKIIFEPCKPPEDSGVVLTDDQINKVTATKM